MFVFPKGTMAIDVQEISIPSSLGPSLSTETNKSETRRANMVPVLEVTDSPSFQTVKDQSSDQSKSPCQYFSGDECSDG